LKRPTSGLGVQIKVLGKFEYDAKDLLEHAHAIVEVGS